MLEINWILGDKVAFQATASLFCLQVVDVQEFHDSWANIEFCRAAFLVGHC